MTVNIKALFFVFSAAVAVVCRAAEPYERYQSIIDRKPFGPEPVNFDPEAAPGSEAADAAGSEAGGMTAEQRTAEEQQMASSVRVSMINVTPAGAVAVGFTDNSVQPAENYYLIVGRSQNGWTVKNADPGTESVTLEKGGVEVTVKLGESSGGEGGKGGNRRLGRSTASRLRGDKTADAPLADEAHPVSGRSRIGGLAQLRQRRNEMRAKEQAAAEKKAEAAAVAAAEREEREAKEAEEKQARAEREAREAEELAQQREALRQIQEQLRKDREARESERHQSEEGQEE